MLFTHFIAQTGMRVSDALAPKIGDTERTKSKKKPLAIKFTPKKDCEAIGERITSLGTDGVNLLKEYLKCREKNGETITEDSPLFIGRSKCYGNNEIYRISAQMFNETIKEAKKAGVGNGNGKFTQLTNHGAEDKLVNFMTCHKIPEVYRVYWFRRVEELREIYRQREKFLNPISRKTEFDLKKLCGLRKKINDLESKIDYIYRSKRMTKHDT